jgi:hypothetical protein
MPRTVLFAMIMLLVIAAMFGLAYDEINPFSAK